MAHLVNRTNTVNGARYKEDPTVFAWELMNEPRMDCADDPTPDKRYCDASGQNLAAWIASESAYIKSLDRRHMVAAGAEAHGLVQTPSGPFQWARDDEGNGNDPWASQDAPDTDFVSFHPYPNASWARYTFAQTKDLFTGLTRTGVKRGKPVVMSEFGVFRSQAITGAPGLLHADEHLPALVINADPDTAARLRDRAFEPLGGLSPRARERRRDTLRAWLDLQGHQGAVARTLGIHQQTVRYRIARLRELLPIDDPEARFTFALALRGPPTGRVRGRQGA